MINDFGLEFMIGDLVSFKPPFELCATDSSHSKGTVSGIHGHNVFINLNVYDGDKEIGIMAVRFLNDITAVIAKAETQLTLLD